MNKICVFTCITGDYDNLYELEINEPGIDYLCYTNNKNLKSDIWKIIYIQDEELDDALLSRKIKILGTPELKKYDVTVWTDACMVWNSSIKDFIDKQVDLNKYDVVGIKHHARKNINEEINACYEYGKISLEMAKRIRKYYSDEVFPDNNVLTENGIMFRNFNNKKVQKAMKMLFDMLLEFCGRDQLFLQYVQWKTDLKINPLEINIWNNEYIHHFNHNFNSPYLIDIYRYFNNYFDINNLISLGIKEINNKLIIPINIDYKTDKIRITITSAKSIILNKTDMRLNGKKVDNNCISIENAIPGSKYYFINYPIIIIEDNFEKGDKIEVELDIEFYDKNTVVGKIYNTTNEIASLNGKINQLNGNYEILQKNYDNIVNSKRWKLINKISNALKK